MDYLKKTITIGKAHQEFIKARSINLSRFVQKALDEEMQRQNYKAKK